MMTGFFYARCKLSRISFRLRPRPHDNLANDRQYGQERKCHHGVQEFNVHWLDSAGARGLSHLHVKRMSPVHSHTPLVSTVGNRLFEENVIRSCKRKIP